MHAQTINGRENQIIARNIPFPTKKSQTSHLKREKATKIQLGYTCVTPIFFVKNHPHHRLIKLEILKDNK